MTLTVPASRVKPTVAWLLTQAATITAVSPHDLYVGYGEPVNTDPDDQVYLDREVHSSIEQVGMTTATAAGTVKETFTIPLHVSVFRAGDDGKAAFERCADLVNALVAFVRADQTLGGNVLGAEVSEAVYPTPAPTENAQGRLCETTVTIHCTATS